MAQLRLLRFVLHDESLDLIIDLEEEMRVTFRLQCPNGYAFDLAEDNFGKGRNAVQLNLTPFIPDVYMLEIIHKNGRVHKLIRHRLENYIRA